MPLALHKLLPCFFLPIGASCILIAVSLYKRSRLYAAIALAILFLSSLPATARMAIRLNEDRYPAIAISGVPACDAIVVLGGIVSPSQRRPGTLEWGESVDRFEGGLALFQSGKAPKLVFTGNASDATPTQSEGDLLKAVAIRRGVDGAAILVERHCSNTAEEAQAVRRTLAANARICLVTSASHMPRAALLFERAGLSVVPFPVDFTDPQPMTVMEFIPQGATLQRTETALRELYGRLYYSVF